MYQTITKGLTLMLTSMMLGMTTLAQDAKFVRYEDFGAKGDGKTDDTEAIFKAHNYANQNKLPVKADDKANYLMTTPKTVLIQTDTDWGKAHFIIDDSKLEVGKGHTNALFKIISAQAPYQIQNVPPMKREATSLGVQLPGKALVILQDQAVKRYIRWGANQNNGTPQTDVLLVDKDGSIDPKCPPLWEFKQVTRATAYPYDETPLHVTGGIFTTIANQAESKYNYYSRNIIISRSNTTLSGLSHYITGEGDHGAPYSGFLSISNCADVIVQDCQLSGHKTYWTIGSAGVPVPMGTYDLGAGTAANLLYKNVRQLNNIQDNSLWGIMGSNYCKNMVYDGCTLSRYDAHQGVANATIRNTHIGYCGASLIGCGQLIIENCTFTTRYLVSLRVDYGATWEGDFLIRNCVLAPNPGEETQWCNIICGTSKSDHDFGYPCFMPRKIVIDGLVIRDGKHKKDYAGPYLFSAFDPTWNSDETKPPYPIDVTHEVEIRNLTIESGMKLKTSPNPYLFRNTKITVE